MPRSFLHWYRGVSVETASRSSTSTPWGIRGALTAPVIRRKSNQTDTMAVRLAGGGSGAIMQAALQDAQASATTGGMAPHSAASEATGTAILEFTAAADVWISGGHEASGGFSASGCGSLSTAVHTVSNGGIEVGASSEVRRSMSLTSGGSWSLGGRPHITSGIMVVASGGASTLRRATTVQASELEATAGLSMGGGKTTTVQASELAARAGLSMGGGVGNLTNLTGRSFLYWRRGGVVGDVGPRRGGFEHGYRGWFGIPSAGRIGGNDATVSVELGLHLGASARVTVEHATASTVARCRTIGGTAKEVASSTLLANGGIDIGGSGRIPTHGTLYRIFSNNGFGGSIDYSSPIAEISGLEWTSDALPAGSSFRFGVRSYDPANGLEDENLDAAVTLIINSEGRDATRIPRSPLGLRVLDQGGGSVRLEWTIVDASAPNRATHFHVYIAQDAVTDFSSPIVVPLSALRGDVVATEVHDLPEGRRHVAIVRAVNSYGDDGNMHSIHFTADRTPPASVDGLFASTSAAID